MKYLVQKPANSFGKEPDILFEALWAQNVCIAIFFLMSFSYVYVCMPCMCLVPTEARKEHHIP